MRFRKILPFVAMLAFSISYSAQRMAFSKPKAGIADTGPIGVLGGTISGSVTAPKEFHAAQVYAENSEKGIVYMVYTAGGRYRFMHLFPGKYQLSVSKNGFTSPEVKPITVAAGGNVTADLTMKEGVHIPNRRISTEYPEGVKLLPYDTVYPPGPGRDIAQACLVCHGPDWLSTRQFNESAWNSAINDMIRRGNVRVPGSFSPDEREVLVQYLTQNFGPNSEPRRVAEPDMDVDEAVVSKAMYVEYRLPSLPPGHKPLDGRNVADDGDIPGGSCADRSCGPRRLHDPHIGNDGNVWYADQVGLTIGKVDPRTGVFKDYPIEDPTAPPHGLTMDQKGQIWFTSANALGRFDPETGEMRFYKRSNLRSGGNTATVDGTGDVWYTGGVSEIGQWDHTTDKVNFYKTPSFEPQPYGMVTDKSGQVWFAMLANCKVVKFDPVARQFTEFSAPYVNRPCTIRRLSFDHDGMLWYGLAGNVNGYQKIVKMDPKTAKTTEYATPYRFTWPYDVQADPENNIWMPDSGEGGALVKFDRKTEKFLYFPTPQTTDSPKLEVSRDGAIWYTTRSGDEKKMSIGVLYPNMETIKSFAAYNQ